METNTVPSLQKATLVNIVLSFCYKPEIRDLLDDRKLYVCNTQEAERRKQRQAWQTVRKAIQEKVSSLNMCLILENLLLETSEMILEEIINWVKRKLWYYINNVERIMKNLQWSPDGKIIESYTVYAILDEKEPSHGPKHEKMELLYKFLTSRPSRAINVNVLV